MLWLGLVLLAVSVATLLGRRGRLSLPGALSGSSSSTPRSEPARSKPARAERPSARDSLGSVQDGEFVTLTGRIQSCAEPLTAPLSGAACAAYVAVARSPGGGSAVSLDVDLQEMKIAPLVVAVSDGSIIVEGECVVVLRTSAVSPRLPERERAFLARRQLQHYLPSTEFAEATLCVDDWIWVSGVAQRELAGDRGYRDQPVRTRLVSGPGRPLTLGRARTSPRRISRAQ
jgi:hypothetical protein